MQVNYGLGLRLAMGKWRYEILTDVSRAGPVVDLRSASRSSGARTGLDPAATYSACSI